ncbi:MAG: hypothetical protein UX14_C0035G0005 [Parcubacteria group bacterium GW2011_GWF1_45_5]|nr:MAG: hypothetical protein UX14_C0035G0005 [Parcubacteria group bacterium GW2011_GWF1_45_5]
MDIEQFPQTVLKFYKLRTIITKAWRPLGIGRDEAADILIWAIGDDVKRTPFDQWPERIMDNTGIKFDPRQSKVLDVLRTVAKEWQRRKIKPVYVGGLS